MGVGVSRHRRRPQRGAWTDVRRGARSTKESNHGSNLWKRGHGARSAAPGRRSGAARGPRWTSSYLRETKAELKNPCPRR